MRFSNQNGHTVYLKVINLQFIKMKVINLKVGNMKVGNLNLANLQCREKDTSDFLFLFTWRNDSRRDDARGVEGLSEGTGSRVQEQLSLHLEINPTADLESLEQQ